MAERGGFEPPKALTPYALSKRAHSATMRSLLRFRGNYFVVFFSDFRAIFFASCALGVFAKVRSVEVATRTRIHVFATGSKIRFH